MTAPDLQYVVPFFQPIIRADDQSVYAYEVLGREVINGKVKSLGPYFESPDVSDADKLKIDMHIRTQAFTIFAQMKTDAKLFINLMPSWVYAHVEDKDSLPTVLLLDQFAIDPGRIVIEVTEEELLGDLDAFSRVITLYRRKGCLLAIDDFGKGASSVDRIAYVKPDIIKIDKDIVQKVDSDKAFYDVTRAMNSFGAVSGFDILFEGVETPFQLECSIKAKGRYIQGYIFSQARPAMDNIFDNKDLLADIISLTKHKEEVVFELRANIKEELDNIVNCNIGLLPRERAELANEEALVAMSRLLPYYCLSCWVCERSGVQVSLSYRLQAHKQVSTSDGIGCDWYYQSFFFEGLSALSGANLSHISRLHKSVETKEDVVTYMHSLSDDMIFCVNIMSSYVTI